MSMDRTCVLCFITLASFIAQGDHASGCKKCQQVCAYSNSWSTDSCFDSELRCDSNTHIEILNAVCGARKYFDNSCIPNIYSSNKCYAQTFCCRRGTGDQRWPMADEHRNRLDQACYGKKQCRFKAPVDQIIDYNIHYCYVLYRCATDFTLTTTEITPTSTIKTVSTPITTVSASLGPSKVETFTTPTNFNNPGMHRTMNSHVSTHSIIADNAPADSADLPLSVVIVPVVLFIFGIVLGIVLWKCKRRKRKKHEPTTKGAIDQQTIQRDSNQYETMSLADIRTTTSAEQSRSLTESTKSFAETNSNQPSHTVDRFEARVSDISYSEIDFQQTETASKVGRPKEPLSNDNEDYVEANDNEAPEYFILEAEDTYNEIDPTDVEEYNEQATPDSEYNRLRFSDRAFTADPNYDKLGGDRAESKGDYSILSDNVIHLTVMTDYSHVAAQINVNNEQDDQYSD